VLALIGLFLLICLGWFVLVWYWFVLVWGISTNRNKP